MHRKWIMIVAALLAAWPATLAAQGTPRPQRAPRAARPPSAARAWAYATSYNRGRIGVIPKSEADPESDKFGAKIEGVTPGGPAAKAGLKVGDIITKFNNTSLAGLKAEDEEESGPSSKLVELAHKLEPGDTVQIEYRRGNDTKKATLVAEDLGSSFRVEIPNMTEPHTMIIPPMPRMNNFEVFGSPRGELDLVTL